MDLSASSEDYISAIWKFVEWTGKAPSSTALAKKLDLSPSTVSEGITRLVRQGLVSHAPYGSVELTGRGQKEAARLVRGHRVIETALVRFLGYTWDEVHEEAERLEHAASPKLIGKLDALLGYPSHDPHGDPIPRLDGTAENNSVGSPLSDAAPGHSYRIERVSDQFPDLLQYLSSVDVEVGTVITVDTIGSGTGIMHMSSPGGPLALSLPAAESILVTAI
ncbi:metal-dependent transcriptional regulator [Actinobaculum suis]|uniref:metal-dependent transcriptional regulator n=1 Tax=Actinobaculum suis TaxID=1657 RepID=UPI000809E921|nr:metal-dependent transcriptional regulator [Actinobaculum suis]OCA93665.1 hypothetical protein ACU20_08430 [Actinobaculum suis]